MCARVRARVRVGALVRLKGLSGDARGSGRPPRTPDLHSDLLRSLFIPGVRFLARWKAGDEEKPALAIAKAEARCV